MPVLWRALETEIQKLRQRMAGPQAGSAPDVGSELAIEGQ
jgi:hypothetical protein